MEKDNRYINRNQNQPQNQDNDAQLVVENIQMNQQQNYYFAQSQAPQYPQNYSIPQNQYQQAQPIGYQPQYMQVNQCQPPYQAQAQYVPIQVINNNNQYPQIITGIPIQQQYIPYNGQQVIIVQAEMTEKLMLELKIKRHARWFTGCNGCWSILLILNLVNRVSVLKHEDEESEQAEPLNDTIKGAIIIFIIEYIIWFICIFFGIYSISKYRLKLLQCYIAGLAFVMFLETISNIMIFASFSEWYAQRKISVAVIFILNLLVQYSFIHNARVLSLDMKKYEENYQNQNIQQQNNQFDMNQ